MNQLNTSTLEIHAQPRAEVMERVLRVVRHRGFNLCASTWSRIANSCGSRLLSNRYVPSSSCGASW